MATRKRTSRRTGLVDRAVRAGRQALREAEKRVPPDLRRQLERRLKDADKTARAAIKQLQAQAKKASTRADVNSVLKRIDGLTKQARQIAGSRSRATATATRGRAASATRRAATRTKKAAGAAGRKATTRASTARRTATARSATTPRRKPATRRPRARAASVPSMPETMAPEAGGAVEMGEITNT